MGNSSGLLVGLVAALEEMLREDLGLADFGRLGS